MKLLLASLALVACVAQAEVDPRFAGTPARDPDGSISRSMRQRALFVRMHPCPATGQITGACQGWAVDHVIPLVCGGVDAPINMAWMPNAIKSGPGQLPKDRWEVKVYCTPQTLVIIK